MLLASTTPTTSMIPTTISDSEPAVSVELSELSASEPMASIPANSSPTMPSLPPESEPTAPEPVISSEPSNPSAPEPVVSSEPSDPSAPEPVVSSEPSDPSAPDLAVSEPFNPSDPEPVVSSEPSDPSAPEPVVSEPSNPSAPEPVVSSEPSEPPAPVSSESPKIVPSEPCAIPSDSQEPPLSPRSSSRTRRRRSGSGSRPQSSSRSRSRSRSPSSRVSTPCTTRSTTPPRPCPSPLSDTGESCSQPAPGDTTTTPPSSTDCCSVLTAAQVWQRRKDEEGAKNSAVDDLMELIGLEDVKQQVLAIHARAELCRRQNLDLREQRFNIVFQGNPGTGKTTVARLYARFLKSVGAIDCSTIKETCGTKLTSKGPRGIKKTIRKMQGGVFFIDEAYQLTAPYASNGGREALDIILTAIENNIGRLVAIFVGYNDEMQSFFEHNPGLSSRIPYTLQFADFSDTELWTIFRDNFEERYDENATFEDGIDGLYMRIAIRRLARSRAVRGFGNARSVENLQAQIEVRQARRVAKLRSENPRDPPDDYHFTKEDIIGPNPGDIRSTSAAWKKLRSMIGLDQVKTAVEAMVDMLETNYRRELLECAPLTFALNRVFFGNPGTGKTTVAKLYGEILADLGLLSNGEVVIKNPADFIGECLGKSEVKTRKILAATVGKVLIIDEAYMLNSGGGKQDSFKMAVIDTLVAEVQAVPGDDRCVLLLGYEDKLRDLFQNVNPGLARRFAIDDPFRFQDFDVPQLQRILELKMKEQDISATEPAMAVALDLLDRARMRPNFSNGGDVDNFLTKAKFNYQTRQSKKPVAEREIDACFEPEDFDADCGRRPDCRALLNGLVGNDIIGRLEDLQDYAVGAKEWGQNVRETVPMMFVFKGPPGTGKTTTALKMGQIYYDMGLLSTAEVIECSASDLIGQYVGHTSPKTKSQLERALGKTLLIDQAYRLTTGEYASEAATEMVQILESPRYKGNIVVILAGYTYDMDVLMKVRPALSGIFIEEITFQNIQPHDCLALLAHELERKHISAPFLTDRSCVTYHELLKMARALSLFQSWANARDVKTLAGAMSNKAFRSNPRRSTTIRTPPKAGEGPPLSDEEAIRCMKDMLMMRHERQRDQEEEEDKGHASQSPFYGGGEGGLRGPSCARSQAAAAAAQNQASSHDIDQDYATTMADPAPHSSLSSDVCRQLIQNTRAQMPPPSRGTKRKLASATAADELKKLKVTPEKICSNGKGGPREEGVSDAAWNQLQHAIEVEDALVRNLTATEREQYKRKKQEIQQKLRKMDRCPIGYAWHRTSDGYTCDGGSHHISDRELA